MGRRPHQHRLDPHANPLAFGGRRAVRRLEARLRAFQLLPYTVEGPDEHRPLIFEMAIERPVRETGFIGDGSGRYLTVRQAIDEALEGVD